MRLLLKRALVVLLLTLIGGVAAMAQEPQSDEGGPAEKKPEAAEKKKDKKDKIKPYDEVITDKAVSDPGLFLVHRDGDDVYFEIPPQEFGKDMLWVTQIAETQAGFSWAGMPVGDRVVRWEQRGDRVLLRDVHYDIRADVDDPIKDAVRSTSLAPIIHVFDVEAYGKDKAPVIKASELFTADQREFTAQEQLNTAKLDPKRTFVDEIKSFPENIETRVLATYNLEKPKREERGRGFPGAIPRDPTQSGVSVVLHHSMVKLPEQPMRPREFDDRVGFFSVGFNDYGDDSEHAVKTVRYITRWRLEKKNPKAKVSEPVKPIVWYVSREVPAKWQPYVIQGIEAWQPAFEAAGFKKAIVGQLAPTPQEDPDWDAEDARYTTIRWLPSSVPNAFGPHISDPRTGEILEADVRMFHNVIKLVRDWYFVQASPNDPRAQKLPMPDELMGRLITFVVAHEVGHSLGFPHNMKASSSYSIAQLRDAEFTKANGTAPSIMDYARFNYVAQPGDGAALLPGVGPYDRFAVEWGYRQFREDADEKAELEKIVAAQKDNPMLRFGNPNPREDPTQQTEDLGADAVEATRLGLLNLERVAGYLIDATSVPGKDYDLLANMHKAMLGQWTREMGHVANIVGGVERINLYYGDADRRFFPIDAGRQRAAVDFLNENAFQTPEMFVRPDVTGRIEASGVADRLLEAQRAVLRSLIDERRIKRMSETAERESGTAYPPAEMLDDLTDGVWSELEESQPSIDLYRRNLQRAYVNLLADKLDSDDTGSDMPALARGELTRLLERSDAALDRNPDATTADHLHDVEARIKLALEPVRIEREAGTDTQGGRGRGLDQTGLPESCWPQ